jgi:hypothetical protein
MLYVILYRLCAFGYKSLCSLACKTATVGRCNCCTSHLPPLTKPRQAYNTETGSWELQVSGIGANWVPCYVGLLNTSDLSFDGVTCDSLKDWIYQGWQRYEDVLQTTWPDLSVYHGVAVNVHRESGISVPAALQCTRGICVQCHVFKLQIHYGGLMRSTSVPSSRRRSLFAFYSAAQWTFPQTTLQVRLMLGTGT